ncbi:putative protein IWS1 [Cocos nucifera]|uniref:TFIIS N-terminal domain-containing protein n=1 Tax=Cocos nucifera TaxID=13894 RepID=A0A8K0IS56_COCNU|nr:putative protein IWS1 [Cocos nucifera]
MVFKKKLECSFNGYQLPAMPQIPISAKGKRSVRRKVVDNRMCAFDLLIAVAGKILERDNSSTVNSIVGNSNQNVKPEQLDEEKFCKDEAFHQVSCNESTSVSELPIQRWVIQTLEEHSQIPNATASGPTCAIVKSDALNKDTCASNFIANGSKEEFAYSLGTTAKKCCTESHSPGSVEFCDAEMVDKIKTPFLAEQHEVETGMFKNIQHAWNLDNPKELDAKPPALSSSDSSIEMPLHGHHIPPISSFPICKDDMELAVDRDDDENSFRCTNPSTITSKALKPQYHKIRKLSSRTANCTSSSATGQIALCKSEDFRVKLSIKSFKVPELFIEIPETATVGSLKRTVMEAVTAILGGGLHVGVLLQGKKVRDDSKTLLQAGISHVDKMDNLGFMLEPSSTGASTAVINLEYRHSLLPCDATEPLASPEPQLNSALNFSESDDSVYSPIDTKLLNIAPAAPPTTATTSRAVVPVPTMSIEALSMVPLHKPRRSELPQRRIRRPFSVSEVEALVQAVEKLGTGRWRDVKLQAFDNAKHRTYVDLKGFDLIHTSYMDEDGEPLMDPDVPSDRDPSPETMDPIDDDDEGDWLRERSPTPVLDSAAEGKAAKPRKRLVKKNAKEGSPDWGGNPVAAGLDDWEEEPSDKKRKKAASLKERKGGSGGKDKKKKSSSSTVERSSGKGFKSGSKGFGGGSEDQAGDPEMKELWDTIAGGDSEDDREGVRTVDDDNFIDDSGVDPADRLGSDNEAGYAGDFPQAEEGEEDDEISKLFKAGKKKKKNEKSPAELAMIVEHLMAELEVTAEEDAELNRQNKPAVNKLKKLPLLVDVLSKKKLQQEFLDHGVLTLLKNWLEPLPDGSLPNMNIRTAILKLLTDVIMFLSKSDEETTSNRKLAKELVDKWSRPIFNKSTRFEDMRSLDDERVPYRRPFSQKSANKAMGLESRDDDLDLAEFSQGRKSGQAASRQHASRPEALPLDFIVRPQSKVDPEEVRARAKQSVQDQHRLKMNRKLQQLKAPKKRQLQASKLSVEGRGMVKYL